MPALSEYLIKLTIGLSLVGLFYQVALSKLTFYNWNRWYLLIYSALAFVIPLVDFNAMLPQGSHNKIQLVEIIPAVQDFVPVKAVAKPTETISAEIPETVVSDSAIDWQQILLYLFFAGTIAMALRLVLSWLAYLSVKRNAELVTDEEVEIYHTNKEIAPFSFGKGVFFNPDLHSSQDLSGILIHELVHVRQRHSIDIIWAELLCVVNWFNPLVWMIRHAIRQNHEYIADREVLESGMDATQYQYLLLKVVGVPDLLLGNQFNISSLKNRIIMMNKSRTARIYLVRFLFTLPVLTCCIILFRERIQLKAESKQEEELFTFLNPVMTQPLYMTALVIDGESGLPIPGLPQKLYINDVFVREIATDANGFYCERVEPNDSIRSVKISYESEVYKMFDQFQVNRGKKFGGAQVVFAVKNVPTELITGTFWQDMSELEYVPDQKIKEATLDFLQQKASLHAKEYHLISTFRTEYHWTNQEITQFQGAYFDSERNLIGYVDELKFYLDGKESTFREINEAFEFSPVEMLNTERLPRSSMLTSRLASKMHFYTFVTSKVAPPEQYISSENMMPQNVEEFDLSRLEDEAYMLDGFRQIEGIGSNLKPLKEEIKRVYLFKGNLARYYDRKLDKIWWIETRPVTEVYGRPNLAMK